MLKTIAVLQHKQFENIKLLCQRILVPKKLLWNILPLAQLNNPVSLSTHVWETPVFLEAVLQRFELLNKE